MADVFISYKREDRAVAEQLAGALEQLGFDVWWDFALLSGDQYRKVIREVINQCKAAIVLWSTKAVDSEFVMDEAAHAKSQNKLCPVRIDGVELPFGFGQTHTDDLRDWSGEMSHHGFASLLRALESRTGKKARLGARSRDASGERAAVELEAFKAAQIAGTQDALQAFLRKHPAGVFSDFVRSQLGGAAPTPPPPPRPEPASFASTAKIPPREEKRSAWPVIAALALLIGAGGVGWTMWQGAAATRIAEADPTPAPVAAPAVPARDVDAEIEAARAEERNRADDAAFALAQSTDTSAAYQGYLAAWPSGRNESEARTALAAAMTREGAASAQASANAQAARDAAAQQQAQREQAARDQADDNAYAVAKSANTIAAYDAYLRSYANGRNASAARSARSSVILPAAAIGTTYAAFDLSQLNPSVRAAAEQARAAKSKADAAAARARDGVPKAEDAARRARNGEAGFTAFSDAKNGGFRYEGGYSNNLLNGYGVSTWSDGDRYAGQSAGGQFSGVGVYTYGANDNSLRNEGEYSNSKRNGFGITIWRDGDTYSGGFRDDGMSGYGVYQHAADDGSGRYEGEYANDDRNGFGVFWDKNGKVQAAGVWSNDKLTTSLTR